MRPIQMLSTNKDRLEAALETVNGRARRHTVSRYEELEEIAAKAWERMHAILPRKAWKGAHVTYRPEGARPGRQSGYTQRTTEVKLRFAASGVSLVGARKVTINGGAQEYLRVSLTRAQARAAEIHVLATLHRDFDCTALERNAPVSAHDRLALEQAAQSLLQAR